MLYHQLARQEAAANHPIQASAQAKPTPPSATSNIVQLRSGPFIATMYGAFGGGPGHLSGQSQTLIYRSAGTASQFLHGYLTMSFVKPTDPTAPIVGNANLIAKNVGQSGTELLLDLTADPTSLVDGLPTRFTWTVNSSSSGFYIGASGSGTGQIVYVPGHGSFQHFSGAGNFGVRFQGTIFTVPVTNILVY
jgi:hypothetical protein